MYYRFSLSKKYIYSAALNYQNSLFPSQSKENRHIKKPSSLFHAQKIGFGQWGGEGGFSGTFCTLTPRHKVKSMLPFPAVKTQLLGRASI